MTAHRRPLKSLGQNFLTDSAVIGRIITAAAVCQGDNVLEIGPGRGALTQHLVEKAGCLVLVEFDHLLADGFRRGIGQLPRVTVIDGDILTVDLEGALSSGSPWKVVANLPYNISTAVLFRMLDIRERLSRMTLMLQKEVGDRLTAPPGCAEYGVTTVLLGLWFDIRQEFVVPPECFYPAPKVDSAVLAFTPLAAPRVDVGDEQLFRRMVKSAFSMRRKTLSNCFRAADWLPSDLLPRLLAETGIDGRRRGETLSIGEFALLSRKVLEITAPPAA